MHIFSKCFHLCICHILVNLYIGVVDYSSSKPISSVVNANVYVFSLSFDNSYGDIWESTLIIAVDRQQW